MAEPGKKRSAWLLILVFLVIFFCYEKSGISTSSDSRWSVYTALSIINEGNTDLNEYQDLIKKNDFYAVTLFSGRYYDYFPIGAPLVAMPIIFAMVEISDIIHFNFEGYVHEKNPEKIEKITASFIVAFSAVFIYLFSSLLLNDKKLPLLIVFIYAFCTSAWSTASRGLWQHGPSMLILSIVIYLLVLAGKKGRGRAVPYIGFLLAFSYVIRPTNAIPIFLLTVYIWMNHRKYFLRYLLTSAVVVVPFILYNLNIYGSVLPPYYMPQRVGSNGHFLEALAGNLISPARGLFIFSPVLIFSIYGFLKKERERLDYFFIVIIILHWLVISSFPHWWGGYCFGPRFFSDAIPFMIFFMAPAVSSILEVTAIKRAALAGAFIVFMLASAFAHYRGANAWSVHEWNVTPVTVDERPERVWDYRDIQFLRGL